MNTSPAQAPGDKRKAFFFELLPTIRDAHRSRDEDTLRRGYDFARRCFRHGGELENAAAVAFYEHLFHSGDVHDDVLRWLDQLTVL